LPSIPFYPLIHHEDHEDFSSKIFVPFVIFVVKKQEYKLICMRQVTCGYPETRENSLIRKPFADIFGRF
jgi:hypothetical protein